MLQHASAPDRDVALYWGRKRARAEHLLPTYSTLLGRPIVEARPAA